MTSAVFAFK